MESSEIFLYDPNNQTKKSPQIAEIDENKVSDNKSIKNDELTMKNGEVTKEPAQNVEEDKLKKNQADPLMSQSSVEEQKQIPNNLIENKPNLNNNN